MAKNKAPSFDQLAQKFRGIYARAPRAVGSMAVRKFKQNFQKQGWTPDNVTMPWKNRAAKDRKKARRALLIKTGALRRSVRIITMGNGWVKVGSNLEYAKIHNEGGTINATQSVGSYKRKAHTRKVDGKRQRVKEAEVKAHTRKVNTKIPKRKFIGPSSGVMREANEWFKKEISKAVKQWR